VERGKRKGERGNEKRRELKRVLEREEYIERKRKGKEKQIVNNLGKI